MRQAVINYHINGLPRSEISAKTGISTGAVSNIIKNWKEKAEEIPDVEDIRGFMKQVYKTGYTVKECAQGFIILQMMESFYDNKIQDAEIPTIFWSFINDIYTPCIKLGITPSFIPGWINDLWGFFSQPNRRGDIIFSPNSQNESDKQCNGIKSTNPNPNPNPSSSQLTYLYSIERPEIAKISDAKKENLQHEYNAHGRSHDRK